MQSCGKCGNYNSDESIFCGHCANRLNNNCPDCGFKNLMQQKFCGSCGKQLLSDMDGGLEGLRQPPAAPAAATPSVASSTSPAAPAAPSVVESLSSQSQPLPPVDAYPSLETYALLSIEIANWKQLLAESAEPDRLTAYQAQVLDELVRHISEAGGEINASKNNVLFVSFRHETSPEKSIERGIETALLLLSLPFQFYQTTLRLRMGLDAESARARNPLTSTLERSVGQPGSLIVSERIYQIFSGKYPMTSLGPMTIGNRSMTFYSVAARLPQPQEVLSPSRSPHPAASASPGPAHSTQNQISQSAAPTQTHDAWSEPKEPPVNIASSAAAPVQTGPPVEQHPASAQLPPPLEPERPVVQAPSASQETETAFPAPSLPEYRPPQLIMQKPSRADNLTYEMAVESLTSEFSAFLAQGVSAGKGKVLTLCADDGLGKSSILHMARAKADPENQRGIWMGGTHYRAFQRDGLPLFYWIELVQNLLSLVFEGQPGGSGRDESGMFMGCLLDG